jgi:hypothetical protein
MNKKYIQSFGMKILLKCILQKMIVNMSARFFWWEIASCEHSKVSTVFKNVGGGAGLFGFPFLYSNYCIILSITLPLQQFLHLCLFLLHLQTNTWGTCWRSWLRHCVASWKVTGSIPDGFTGILHWHNTSGRTMALELTQPQTEMSARNNSSGVKAADA